MWVVFAVIDLKKKHYYMYDHVIYLSCSFIRLLKNSNLHNCQICQKQDYDHKLALFFGLGWHKRI